MWGVTVGLGCKLVLFFLAVKKEYLFINLGFYKSVNVSCIHSWHIPFVMCVDMDFYLRVELICTEFAHVSCVYYYYDILQQEQIVEFQYLFLQLNVLCDVLKC